jgi:hypothetical protein
MPVTRKASKKAASRFFKSAKSAESLNLPTSPHTDLFAVMHHY